MALPYLFWWLSQVTIVAAFIISLLYCFRKYNPFYLRLFPFYHLTRLIAEGTLLLAIINGTDLHSGSLPASHGSFAFFESLFFSFIIFRQISYSIFVFSHLAITAIYAATFFFLFHNSSIAGTLPARALLLTYIYIIGECLLYFMDLFSLPQPSLSSSPLFWIIVGIFFSAVIVIPMLVVHARRSILPFHIYLNISGAAYTALHLLFIKAYLCKSPESISLN